MPRVLSGEEAIRYAIANPGKYSKLGGQTPSVLEQVKDQEKSFFQGGLLGDIASGITSPFRGLIQTGADVISGIGGIAKTGLEMMGDEDRQARNLGTALYESGKLDKDEYKKIVLNQMDPDLRKRIWDRANELNLGDRISVSMNTGGKNVNDVLAESTAVEKAAPNITVTQAEKDRYWENPLLGGAKQAAGIASFAIPGGGAFGGGIKGAAASGLRSGALSGFGASKSQDVGDLIKDTIGGAATGAATSAALSGIGKVLGKGKKLLSKPKYDDSVLKASLDAPVGSGFDESGNLIKRGDLPDGGQRLRELGVLDRQGNVVSEEAKKAVKETAMKAREAIFTPEEFTRIESLRNELGKVQTALKESPRIGKNLTGEAAERATASRAGLLEQQMNIRNQLTQIGGDTAVNAPLTDLGKKVQTTGFLNKPLKATAAPIQAQPVQPQLPSRFKEMSRSVANIADPQARVDAVDQLFQNNPKLMGTPQGEQLRNTLRVAQEATDPAQRIAAVEKALSGTGKGENALKALGATKMEIPSINRYDAMLERISKMKDKTAQQDAVQALISIVPDDEPYKQTLQSMAKNVYGVNDAGKYAAKDLVKSTVKDFTPPKDTFIDDIAPRENALQRAGSKLEYTGTGGKPLAYGKGNKSLDYFGSSEQNRKALKAVMKETGMGSSINPQTMSDLPNRMGALRDKALAQNPRVVTSSQISDGMAEQVARKAGISRSEAETAIRSRLGQLAQDEAVATGKGIPLDAFMRGQAKLDQFDLHELALGLKGKSFKIANSISKDISPEAAADWAIERFATKQLANASKDYRLVNKAYSALYQLNPSFVEAAGSGRISMTNAGRPGMLSALQPKIERTVGGLLRGVGDVQAGIGGSGVGQAISGLASNPSLQPLARGAGELLGKLPPIIASQGTVAAADRGVSPEARNQAILGLYSAGLTNPTEEEIDQAVQAQGGGVSELSQGTETVSGQQNTGGGRSGDMARAFTSAGMDPRREQLLKMELARRLFNKEIGSSEANTILTLLGVGGSGGAPKMSDKQRQLSVAQSQAASALELLQSGEARTGKLGNIANNVEAFLGTLNPKMTDYRAKTAAARGMALSALSGANIPESEYARLVNMIPEDTDEPALAEQKLKSFIQTMGEYINSGVGNQPDTSMTSAYLNSGMMQ